MEPEAVEDVILKYSELGKSLMSNSDYVSSWVPYEIFPDDQGASIDVSHYPNPAPAESSSSSSPRDSPVNVEKDDCDRSEDEDEDEEDYSMIENQDLIVQNRYSRENRLANNSRHLSGKLGEITATLHDIELRSLELSCLDKEAPESGVLLENLVQLKIKYSAQLMVIDNLVKAEDVLLAQITKPKPATETCPKNPVIPKETREELEPILFPETDQCSTTTDESDTTFETNVTDETNDEASEDTYRPDEFYECNEFTSDIITGSDESDPDEFTIQDEFECNQRVVLDELKQTLRPVRFDMANREREAYTRTYGNPPPEENDEVDEAKILRLLDPLSVRRNSRPPRESNDPTPESNKYIDFYFGQNSSVNVNPDSIPGPSFQPCPEENFGDADAEEYDMKLFPGGPSERQSNNYLNILRNTIEGRSDRIVGGLSPIYKRDKLEPESDSD